MAATIYDVAKRARVSIATVSRVMNGNGHVATETRDRVLAAAEALGYQPRASARGLALNSTETIAIVFPHISGPYFAEIILGVETEARQHDYHLLVYTASSSPADESFLPLLPARVDGMILADHCVNAEYLLELVRRKVPFVVLGGAVPGIEINAIMPENRSGAYQATAHFIDHGYRRIAFIAGAPSSDHSTDRTVGLPRRPGRARIALSRRICAGGRLSRRRRPRRHAGNSWTCPSRPMLWWPATT